jgi:hypothetical protein
MERSHSFWIAVAALFFISSLVGHPARAQLPDVCVSAGGTAECTGPEVGDYQYIAGATQWPGIPAYQWWPSEEDKSAEELDSVRIAPLLDALGSTNKVEELPVFYGT